MKQRPNRTDMDRTANHSALFGTLLVLVIIRLCVSSNILNLVMNYSTTGGTFLEKIHPASWGLLVLAALFVPRIANNAVSAERKIIVAMLVMATLTCLAAMVPLISGSSDLGLGYLIDSVLTA